VAVRPVHVSEFQVRGGRTAAGTKWDEGAVVALFPRGERLEARGCGSLNAALIPVDVPGRELRIAGESRARVDRAIRADGVRVLTMDLAWAHVHAVDGAEAALLRLFTKK
jgi:hypothetical protein